MKEYLVKRQAVVIQKAYVYGVDMDDADKIVYRSDKTLTVRL